MWKSLGCCTFYGYHISTAYPSPFFVIKELFYLVHDGYLWLKEPIPITVDLIHHISQLNCKGKDPMTITEKGRDLALAETMKVKHKLQKKKRVFVISRIKDKGVHVATQLLARKIMRKCRADEVLVSVVALTEWCVEGVQFI